LEGAAVTNWIDVVSEAAESRWENGRPLFLAQIPPLLRARGIDLNDVLRGRSLMFAIEADALSRVQLIKDPDREKSWAVLPSSLSLDFDLRRIFQKVRPAVPVASAAPSAIPLFQKWFFTAFVKALAVGHKRYVFPDRFRDLPQSEAAPPGAFKLATF
jgi:hypothetical protein